MALFAAAVPAAVSAAEGNCFPGSIFMGQEADAALAKCKTLLEKESKPSMQSKILVYMAGAYEEKKDFNQAIASFDKALKLDPNNANAYFWRGSYYKYHGNSLERALANYSAAVLLDPSYPNLSARADIYAQMGRLEEATTDYDAAIRAEPKSVTMLVSRGNIWRQRGGWDRARADYEESLRLDPTYSNALNARSAAHAMLALGPSLATFDQPSQPTAEPRFTWASSRKIGSLTVDVWKLDGKLHHCAVASTYGEPASAIGRSAQGYAVVMASGKWGLRPQNAYAVTVQADGAAQDATGKAADAITLGVPIKPDQKFLSAWAGTYELAIKSPRSTLKVANSGGTALKAVDECWRAETSTSSATVAPSDDPFASAR